MISRFVNNETGESRWDESEYKENNENNMLDNLMYLNPDLDLKKC